jgi:protein involved in polysaccharide export with SLBB domain
MSIKRIVPIFSLLFLFITIVDAQVQKGPVLDISPGKKAVVGDPDLAEFPFRPGDGIQISAFPDTGSFLNGIFPIDERGLAEFPIYGKVKVTEMTMAEFQAFLLANYRPYLRYPNLYIKPVIRISLLGGFVRPGLYYVDFNNSLWDVVQLAGGTIRENGIYKMRWERDHDEQLNDLTTAFESGRSLTKMGFKSGDQIWTPSPDARTFWDGVRDIMPVLTFSTTIWLLYQTYQRDRLILQN